MSTLLKALLTAYLLGSLNLQVVVSSVVAVLEMPAWGYSSYAVQAQVKVRVEGYKASVTRRVRNIVQVC